MFVPQFIKDENDFESPCIYLLFTVVSFVNKKVINSIYVGPRYRIFGARYVSRNVRTEMC